MQTWRSRRKSLSIFPVPSTTDASGSSAIETGKPVSSRMRLSRFFSSAPPPVSTMPRSLISAESSGGVRSSAPRIAFKIVATHSASDSRISLSSIVTVRGTPSIKLRPFTSMVSGFSSGYAEPISILICSAVRSPTSKLYLRFKYCITASSISLPATRTEREYTIPLIEMTAMSVVPPPMSTTIFPDGSSIGRPAPIAAATRRPPQVNLARPRTVRGILHGSFFYRSNLTGHTDHNPRMHQHAAVVRFLNKIRQHFFRDFEVRDHPVLHWLDRHNIARGAAQHFFRFTTHRHNFAGGLVYRHNRRLVYHNPFARGKHQRVRRPQIDRQVGRKKTEHRSQVVSVLVHSHSPPGRKIWSRAKHA